MAFALYEMKVVLSTLFSRVRTTRPPGSFSHAIRRGISLAPDDGAKILITGRL
jgi:cytochrome P450